MANLTREIAVALHIARGGQESDFDLPDTHRDAIPPRSYVWRDAKIVRRRLEAGGWVANGGSDD